MRNTTLCYIEKDGCYLLLHRTKKKIDVNKGKWVGIGGGFEKDESPEEALSREVWEETGLTVTEHRYCGIVTFVSDAWEGEYMHLFHVTGFEGELIECNEGDLAWIKIEDVPSLPQWEGDKIFLKLLEDRVPFFSLKLCYEGDTLVAKTLNGKTI